MLVVIPYFKNVSFLKETLSSLIQQTDPNWTAIILDDSIEAIEAQGAESCVRQLNDPRLVYRKNKANLGLAANWNQGIDLARDHEFLILLHADDRLKRDYIAEMRKLAEFYPEANGYFCRTEIIGENGRFTFSFADWYKERLLPKESILVLSGLNGCVQLIPGNFVFCPSICYRVAKLGNERFRLDLKMVQDFDFILRVLAAGGTWVGHYAQPLFQYRRHTQNATVTLSKNLHRFKEEQTLYLKLANDLAAAGLPVPAQKARQMRVVKLNLAFQALKSILRFDFKSLYREASFFVELYK